jgi:hypothetical protein
MKSWMSPSDIPAREREMEAHDPAAELDGRPSSSVAQHPHIDLSHPIVIESPLPETAGGRVPAADEGDRAVISSWPSR